MPNSPNVRQTLQIGQRLTLRHQLGLTQIIQTARLLSCASEELRDEMEEACRKNPILELDYGPPKAGAETPTSDDSGMAESEDPGLDHSNNSGGEEKGAGAEADEMSARRDHDNTQASSEGSFENYDRDSDYDRGPTRTETLREYLLGQLNVLRTTAVKRDIALAIIDSIDERGYLESSVEEVAELVNRDCLHRVAPIEVLAVLHKIQEKFDPPGVGARCLNECLLIQLRQLPPATPWLAQAQRLCTENLNALPRGNFTYLARHLGVTQHELLQVRALIFSLNLRPGEAFAPDRTEYMVPDVFVRKVRGGWKVELGEQAAPRLRISPDYERLAGRPATKGQYDSLRTHLQEAKCLIKCLRHLEFTFEVQRDAAADCNGYRCATAAVS